LLQDFNGTIFYIVSKNAQKQNFMEILPVGAEMVHGATDGQMDRERERRKYRKA
jgi:hypothetical protein